MTLLAPRWNFDNSYARDLPGLYAMVLPEVPPAPKMVKFNTRLAESLGLDTDGLDLAALLSGGAIPEGARPLAQAYAGHQFGQFNPQLGDGRACLLGEIVTPEGARFDLQLKGSGRTPYSRGGDGKAGLGPVLREYLMSEAMHALGIPTTRSLAAVSTGEPIWRETPQPGAVLARIAASHIRIGTVQAFAAKGQQDEVRRLVDYVIARHYPQLAEAPNPALALLSAVIDRQADLVARWMGVSFIHGVMNTDNMTLSGETIDYGPCAFMDRYAPDTVFSSIDRQGRYAYANQPQIAGWNLTRLAEALLAAIDPDMDEAVEKANGAMASFVLAYGRSWAAVMRAKLGLEREDAGDTALINDLFAAMDGQAVDFTGFFRALSGDLAEVAALFADPAAIAPWLGRWQARLDAENRAPEDRQAAMDAVNPLYIPRNHKVEEALTAAVEQDDLAPFDALLDAITTPFTPRTGLEAYAAPAPDSFGAYRTFCGT